MSVLHHDEVALEPAWVEGDSTARWSSAAGHGPGTGARASGSSLLEVPAGCGLARHTDSAEEIVVVVAGAAVVTIDDQRHDVPRGAMAVIPANVPHEVRNAGEGPLRFVAIYAAPEVVTRYESPIQPAGDQERSPVA